MTRKHDRIIKKAREAWEEDRKRIGVEQMLYAYDQTNLLLILRALPAIFETLDIQKQLLEDAAQGGEFALGVAEGRRLEQAKREDDTPITDEWLKLLGAVVVWDWYRQISLGDDSNLTLVKMGDGRYRCSFGYGGHIGHVIRDIETRGELIRLLEGLTGKDWAS